MYIASVFIISEFFVVHKSGLQQEILPSLFETCRNDNLVEMEGHIALLKSLSLANILPMNTMLAAKRIFPSLMLPTNS